MTRSLLTAVCALGLVFVACSSNDVTGGSTAASGAGTSGSATGSSGATSGSGQGSGGTSAGTSGTSSGASAGAPTGDDAGSSGTPAGAAEAGEPDTGTAEASAGDDASSDDAATADATVGDGNFFDSPVGDSGWNPGGDPAPDGKAGIHLCPVDWTQEQCCEFLCSCVQHLCTDSPLDVPRIPMCMSMCLKLTDARARCQVYHCFESVSPTGSKDHDSHCGHATGRVGGGGCPYSQ